MRDWIRHIKLRLRAANRRRLEKRQASSGQIPYASWIERFDTLTPEVVQSLLARLSALPSPPLISVLMPVDNPKHEWLAQAIESVESQMYPNWELCIADDASTDPSIAKLLVQAQARDARIKVCMRAEIGQIAAASNSALTLARGEFVALLDRHDILPRHALLIVAETLARFPQARVLYSDEDQIGLDGQREQPHFKPDWNPDLLRSLNYVGLLAVFDRALVSQVGGFRLGLEGALDYDLVLRCVEQVQAAQIIHIPHVLCHRRVHAHSAAPQWPQKADALTAGERSVREHLQRLGLSAQVRCEGNTHRIRYALPQPAPKVSVIIPTRNGLALLRQCITGVLEQTDYANLEVIVVDNGSDDAATVAYLSQLGRNARVRVLRDDGPFNYSALNNQAARAAEGEFLCLMNNDIEVIHPDWLTEMVALAARPGTGAVGAKLWYPDHCLQHGGVVLGIGDVGAHAHLRLRRGEAGYMNRAAATQNFSAVTAACLVVARSTYLDAGGLNEGELRVAFNDIDFCLRLQARGLRNVWTPHAELVHHESATRGNDRAAAQRKRCEAEAGFIRSQWAALLDWDPSYNPNLTLQRKDFSLAEAPRVCLSQPWFAGLGPAPAPAPTNAHPAPVNSTHSPHGQTAPAAPPAPRST